MDETVYRGVREGLAPTRCAFEHALLARVATCTCASMRSLAEREAVACTDPAGHAACRRFLEQLRVRAAFALRRPPDAGALPHAVAMRLQCGGLAGLVRWTARAGDVRTLLADALSRNADVDAWPWPAIVADVSAWRRRPAHPSS